MPAHSSPLLSTMPFLQKVVEDIPIDPNDRAALRSLKDYCFVFPTRRAGIYFQKYLTQKYTKQFIWSPNIFNLPDFLEYISEQVLADPIILVFELFKIYKSKEPTAIFDSFYTWGQIILSDFDEIDKYLVDAQKLFSELTNLKDVEEQFQPPGENFEYIKLFWEVLEKQKKTDVEQEFLKLWRVLGEVYYDFTQKLDRENWAYEGRIQRKLAEHISKGEILSLPFKNLVFAGFNGLTSAEEKIFEHLTQYHKAHVYWDTDLYYLKNKRQEAGSFLRNYYKIWQNNAQHNWTSQTDLSKTHKNIHHIGVPLKVGQTKYIGETLAKLITEQGWQAEDTAIILGDESLLFPMLYALPPNIEAVNITMGYPLKNSPLYKLLEGIFQLYKTVQIVKSSDNKKNKTTFYSKFVIQILNNPFIKQFAKEEVNQFVAYLARNNRMWLYPENMAKRLPQQPFSIIFQETTNFLQLIQRFNDLLVFLFRDIKQKSTTRKLDINIKPAEVEEGDEHAHSPINTVTLEFIYHLLKTLRKLQEALLQYRQSVTLETFWRLFREAIYSVQMPFTGEPLRGLQIMSFDQTRSLDFLNIIVLGMNEGNIPATKRDATFIPFNLRRGFSLPTFLDYDAIYAYHFYHLLQRAENVYLVYNTQVDKLGGKEKSRYLLQIEEELARKNANIQVQKKLVTAPLPPVLPKQDLLEVPKNEIVMEKLNALNDAKRSRLTPSALSLYINCPVQFYFKYIAELKELDQIDEDINALVFGNILHRSIELLYIDVLYKKLIARKQVQFSQLQKLVQFGKLVSRKMDELLEDREITQESLIETDLLKSTKTWLLSKLVLDVKRAESQTALETKQLGNKVKELKKQIANFLHYQTATFREVLHKELYRKAKVGIVNLLLQKKNKHTLIEADDIAQLLKGKRTIDRSLNEAFAEEKFDNPKEGKNLLLKKVIKRLIIKVLENDQKDAPFRIIGLEEGNYQTSITLENGQSIHLAGLIDRVDQIAGTGIYRILDYKTGNVNLLQKENLNTYFSNPDYKAGFQAYFYAYLFWRNKKDAGEQADIQAGIYALREVNKGIKFLQKGTLLTDAFFEAFEEKLQALLAELFDNKIPFRQTDKEKRYLFSPYKGLVTF